MAAYADSRAVKDRTCWPSDCRRDGLDGCDQAVPEADLIIVGGVERDPCERYGLASPRVPFAQEARLAGSDRSVNQVNLVCEPALSMSTRASRRTAFGRREGMCSFVSAWTGLAPAEAGGRGDGRASAEPGSGRSMLADVVALNGLPPGCPAPDLLAKSTATAVTDSGAGARTPTLASRDWSQTDEHGLSGHSSEHPL